MYAAKRDGKNCWRLYASDMQVEVYEKILLSNSLRTALEKNEFVLHYQPQMDIKSGKISGFEALIRWNSPQHGLVSPTRFIPVAEQSGLIQSIGKWVIQEACRFVKRLEKEGYRGMYVAVNVSAQQLSKDNFVDMVKQILAQASLEKDQLEIEITESVLLSSVDESIQKLENLRALGIKLSLDDFGVGYSSLTYLRQLPVDTLKIDKSFVDLIGVDPDGAEIIGAIINMAHVLNKNVIAEGVEEEKQLQYLAQKNCDCIQGYFFSKPLPENEAIAFWIEKIG
jgi:EAL domain-containing protein (putative c-di-GMP-specific phosphodiesterase class I)